MLLQLLLLLPPTLVVVVPKPQKPRPDLYLTSNRLITRTKTTTLWRQQRLNQMVLFERLRRPLACTWQPRGI